MDPAEALAELKQVSSQIDRVAIARGDGTIEATTLADPGTAERLVGAARAMIEAAERARERLERPELSQLEVATPEARVFAVRDGDRMIVATTGNDPIVGLVFFDLKACLHNLAGGLDDDTNEYAKDGA